MHSQAPELEAGISNNDPVVCKGTIYQITPKNKTTAIYIKNVTFYSIKQKKVQQGNYGVSRLLVYTDQAEGFKLQNKVEILGNIQKFTKGANPGQFNEYQYYKSLKIDYKIFADKISVVDKAYSYFGEQLQTIRKKLKTVYQKYLPEEDAGIICAMLLGDKSELPQETKELYQKNGISHILAISALHVSMIGLFVYGFLKKIYLPNELSVPFSFLFLLSYAVMTGCSVSTNRAVIMLTVSFCSILLGRTYDFLSSICLSGTIILLQNPYQLINCGFLLSFGAVFGIAVIYPALKKCVFPLEKTEERVEKTKGSLQIFLISWGKHQKEFTDGVATKKSKKLIFKVVDSLLVSFSINLVTLPIILYFYYDFPVYSIFLNLIIIPLVSFIIAFAAILGGVGIFSGFFGMLFAGGIHTILLFYEKLCNLTLALPGSIITVGRPTIIQLVLYYILLFLFLLFCSIYPKVSVFVVMLCFASIFIKLPTSNLTVTVMDVGQGDGILLENDTGTTYFIDGGSTRVKNLEQYRITPCLKSKGIAKIDYAIVTHMDQDHISGLIELLEKSNEPGAIIIETLVLPDTTLKDEAYLEMIELANLKNVHVMYLKKGDKIKDGELSLLCMHPYEGFQTEERNDYSTVLLLEYHKFSMLFTGDVANEGEKALIDNPVLPKCDVYKVAHHGSKYTNSESLLDRVAPTYAIVSAGEGNRYGHPHKEVLERFENRNCPCFSTIEYGAVEVSITKDTMDILGYSLDSTSPFLKKERLGEIQKRELKH